jgi:hypothetical protein
MGRNPHATQRPPELRLALRWLRHRLRLSQGEVAEAVRRQGGALSLRHYQDLEGGQKHPSPILREQILRALGSDEDELRGLLEARPWAEQPRGHYHPSRVLPRPDAYVAAGRRALEALPEGETWSSPVVALAEPPPAFVDMSDQDPLLAELAHLLPRLDPAARQQVLALARRLAEDARAP